MPHQVSVDRERRIVVVVLEGPIDVAHVTAISEDSRAAAREHGFNILYDGRLASAGDMKAADLFWLPRKIPSLAGSGAGRVRTALLHTAAQLAMSRFWEDAFTNVGLQARAFEDEGAAVAWLREAAP